MTQSIDLLPIEIDKNVPIPIYHQLQEGIKRLILNVELQPYDRIPSENDFSKQFEISPMTARQALNVLANDGYVYRQRGLGTYVAPIATFNTTDEAITMANDTPYGLAAYIFTRDLDTDMYAAERVDAGGIGINVNDITDMRGPFGGRKMSGVGRELGQPGMDSYLEWKHVRLLRQAPRQ